MTRWVSSSLSQQIYSNRIAFRLSELANHYLHSYRTIFYINSAFYFSSPFCIIISNAPGRVQLRIPAQILPRTTSKNDVMAWWRLNIHKTECISKYILNMSYDRRRRIVNSSHTFIEAGSINFLLLLLMLRPYSAIHKQFNLCWMKCNYFLVSIWRYDCDHVCACVCVHAGSGGGQQCMRTYNIVHYINSMFAHNKRIY